ncbi:putative 2-(5''-triphosphoribosyl)-3'-dephosphocoenzyme-A synthase [Labrys miyagiensis]|uniref:Probable 2-(5''-triphosphoribosyl)-3'-dephosphocoenzyme-A synthase n=1 Tax=Labrys miyagiensis TaxID=346912 RepID=A0ABQ6CHW0_9HYPH|nr:triphosphoribosyl-dephospho-CoA synthase MdcB [Labrys miyagiensis]GLS19828.1 putative 2-(5''-triphosphoribosyl)-3'-dephosphocoenzyme-A synthase [Labrys miyagiensis]
MTALLQYHSAPASRLTSIGSLAADCLKLEVATYPKPGLVSHVDNGAHHDMDFALLIRGAKTLEPWFDDLAAAGAAGAGMDRLRAIGIEAERAMLAATGGVNTHRGAIFGLGLLCAAAGFRQAYAIPLPLGRIIAERWGEAILSGPLPLRSHGAEACRRHGVGGARLEAAQGQPAVYDIALPALRAGRAATGNEEAARVHACLALIAAVADTNLLHRGGATGLAFAQREARTFMAAGGVGQPNWKARAAAIHDAFVARNLSPGGCADLLAMALFVDREEA